MSAVSHNCAHTESEGGQDQPNTGGHDGGRAWRATRHQRGCLLGVSRRRPVARSVRRRRRSHSPALDDGFQHRTARLQRRRSCREERDEDVRHPSIWQQRERQRVEAPGRCALYQHPGEQGGCGRNDPWFESRRRAIFFVDNGAPGGQKDQASYLQVEALDPTLQLPGFPGWPEGFPDTCPSLTTGPGVDAYGSGYLDLVGGDVIVSPGSS